MIISGTQAAAADLSNGVTGTGAVALSNSPTFTNPVLGTPASGIATNLTGLPLTSGVTGILPIANGGTGSASKQAAFDLLSPMTASGDIIIGGNSGTGTRLAKGTDGQVLTLASGLPSWAAVAGVTGMDAIGNAPNANGASVSGNKLSLQPADANNGGIVTTTTQTIAGAKSLTGNLRIGTTTSTPSAVLEASSTTQGFLPPRMTEAQRNAIVSPAAGLMVYCSDCGGGQPQFYNGTAWKNLIGGTAAVAGGNYAIGDLALGGIIAYILQVGDPGYDANVQHGLVAATVDQSSGIIWSNGAFNPTVGTSATVIGAGSTNTTMIINTLGNVGTYPAKLCRDYTGGGYNDWFLPSKDELNKLNLNRALIGLNTIPAYWSSSEGVFVGTAYSLSTTVGLFINDQKNVSMNAVRAVRAF